MKISEIFKSIDGEGAFAGCPSVFIRTFGCNLNCSYCDSRYACEGDDYQEMTIDDIIAHINYKFPGSSQVTFTGGEPLLQKDAAELVHRIMNETSVDFVNVETNGAVDLYSFLRDLDGEDKMNLLITMDWKSPSSGQESKMLKENLVYLREQDVVKFVVGNQKDLDAMKAMLPAIKSAVFVSPVFGQIEPKEIVEYVLNNHLDDVRVQLQLHKFIWPPMMRGV